MDSSSLTSDNYDNSSSIDISREVDDETRKQQTITLSKVIRKHEQAITDGLTAAVEREKLRNPEKYKSAQLHGEHIMNSSYELQIGQDNTGEKLLVEKLKRDMEFNGLTMDMLDEEEKLLLQKYSKNTTVA